MQMKRSVYNDDAERDGGGQEARKGWGGVGAGGRGEQTMFECLTRRNEFGLICRMDVH